MAEHWHRTARHCPVLVLLHEKQNRHVTDLDLGEYRRRFPELDIHVAEADPADTSDGCVESLRGRVQRLLSGLPHVGRRQPEKWQPIRAAIAAPSGEHHLSFERFHAECARGCGRPAPPLPAGSSSRRP